MLKLFNKNINKIDTVSKSFFSVYKPVKNKFSSKIHLNLFNSFFFNKKMNGVDFTPNSKFFVAKKTPMLPLDTFKGRVAYITGI